MDLTFSQAAKGVNKEIVVQISDTCQRCEGRGHEPGTRVVHCSYCNGTGTVSAGQGRCEQALVQGTTGHLSALEEESQFFASDGYGA